LTSIKIIGDPGKHDVEKIKRWLEDSLKKLNLSLKEIYIVFFGSLRQFQKISKEYLKGTENATEVDFAQIETAAYLDDRFRKEGIPPIILIKKGVKISEETIQDEVAHIAEENKGWNRTILEGFGLVQQDNMGFATTAVISEIPLRLAFFFSLAHRFVDHFSSEMLCQHGLIREAFRAKLEMVNYWIKDCLPKRGELKIGDFDLATQAAFWTTLSPSYPQKEDERKLEEMIIEYIHQMEMEPLYRKIKQAVAKLEGPPKVANIYKCGAEIIELAQDFLEKK